jgi:glycosyltransferase involved in cell wall biosynthesis
MKFLFITGGVPSPIGQNHILDLLNMLSGKHESTVVSCDLGESYLADSDIELRSLAHVSCVPLLRRSKLGRVIRSLFTLTPVAVQGFYNAAMQNAIVAALKQTDYDLVVFEQLVMGQYAGLAGDRPKVFFPVDAVSRFKWQRSRNATNPLRKIAFALDHWMTKRYEKRIYRQFDGALFVSEVDATYVLSNRQVDASKVFLFPLAVDTDYFVPSESRSQNRPSLVFLGNMFNDINEDAILWFHRAVWGRLKQQVPHLQLYVVGNEPSNQVRALAKKDPNVIVTGFLEDIRPPIWDATVFVSPLRMGTGIKNRILQAMAMGKPIVASPAAVEGIDVTDGVHVLVAQNPDDWFKQLFFLLGDLRERERLGRQAREYVEKKYSLEAKTSRFLDIVERVTRSRHSIQTNSL